MEDPEIPTSKEQWSDWNIRRVYALLITLPVFAAYVVLDAVEKNTGLRHLSQAGLLALSVAGFALGRKYESESWKERASTAVAVIASLFFLASLFNFLPSAHS